MKPIPTDPSDLIQRCGEALYGRHWQAALSADLGVSDRTMRRWIAGEPIPAGVFQDLHDLLIERGSTLQALRVELSLIFKGQKS